MYYPSSENKGADQLRGYREADLRLCFRICKLLVFSCTGSNIRIHVLITFKSHHFEIKFLDVSCYSLCQQRAGISSQATVREKWNGYETINKVKCSSLSFQVKSPSGTYALLRGLHLKYFSDVASSNPDKSIYVLVF